MAQVGLQCPRIAALVGQRETAGMPQHMRMSLEAQPGSDAGALDKPCEAGSAEGRTTLGCEDERRFRFLLTCSRRGTRSSSPRIGCIAGVPALARRTARVAQSNRSDPKGDPSTRSNAGRPCTPPGSCAVAMSPSVPLGGIDQLVDLGLGQKLQRSKFRVWLSYWHHDCAVLVGWHNQPQR